MSIPFKLRSTWTSTFWDSFLSYSAETCPKTRYTQSTIYELLVSTTKMMPEGAEDNDCSLAVP